MPEKIVMEGITFDDILVLPARSDVLPAQVDTTTRFSRHVAINVPIASAAMDTVTDSKLAIALARHGGIGVVHRNLTIEDQVRQVDQVKRSANGVILDPVTLPPDATIGRAKEIMLAQNISGLPILRGRKVVGILTRRDLRFQESLQTKVEEVMSRTLVTAPPGTTLQEARVLLSRNKVEKLLLVEPDGTLAGLITMKDINGLDEYPNACRDQRGRLRVGAAVGVHDLERCAALIGAGVDVLVVDTAHGHSTNIVKTLGQSRRASTSTWWWATSRPARRARSWSRPAPTASRSASSPGSICTTRVVAGVGVPQITAVIEASGPARKAGIPAIADGGIRYSGDIVKALAAGAECVMIGSLFAGLDEAPGETVLLKGRSYKAVRGMGSLGAMTDGAAARERYRQGDVKDPQKFVPEGVEGLVPHKGPLAQFVYQLVGGLRSGMGYCGARTVAELFEKSQFVKISPASLRESHPHDIHITREAPNDLIEE
ncbi:MAG: IMP dehydrogenase [Planctomycetota bacterium]